MPQKGQKKVPIRRCVGCGEGKPKKQLVRVVRSKDGQVSLDATGRAAGRGAYLCPSGACLQRAIKRKSLQRAFEAPVPDEVLLALTGEIERLEQAAAGPTGEGWLDREAGKQPEPDALRAAPRRVSNGSAATAAGGPKSKADGDDDGG